jgi:hypothetical protein
MKGISDKDVENLAAVIDLCEYARYAPSSSREENEKVYDDAARFIRLLENTLS